jgi:acyl carrier protein
MTEIVINILHTKVGLPTDIPNIDTQSWEELGIESLGLTETCTHLEHVLRIAIPYEEAVQTENIQELVSLVNSIPLT